MFFQFSNYSEYIYLLGFSINFNPLYPSTVAHNENAYGMPPELVWESGSENG